jgi:hypothetical protein
MIIAMLLIGIVVSMPIVATVVVSVASRREDKSWSLRDPAQGAVQAAARRIVDFHSDAPGWPLPQGYDQVRSGAPARPSVSQPRRSVAANSPRPIATSRARIGTAA